MIKLEIAKNAIAITDELDKRGLFITAAPGTPLSSLNQSATLGSTVSPLGSVYVPDARYIEGESSGWEGEVGSKHTTDLDDMVETFSAYVSSHLNFAKNVVKPVIIELVSEVEADIRALPVNIAYSMNLVVVDPPEPMIAASFEAMVEEFKEVPFVPIQSYLSLAPLSGPEVIEHLLTGSADTDKAIAQWAAKKGDEFFQYVWSCVFTSAPTKDRFTSLIQDRETGVDASIVVFLLAKRLYDNPLEGTAMALPAYSAAMADLRNQSALRLCHAYEEYARYSKTNLLISNYTNTDVFVNGNVYRKWMENGGNNAVIFGSLLSDRPARFVPDLEEKKVEHLARWEQHSYLLTVTERNKRFVRYKEILHGRLFSVVGNHLQECFAHLRPGVPADTNMAEYQQFLKNVDTFVDSVYEVDFKNLWEVCMKAVCQTAFYYTDAEKILSGIEKANRENEGIDVREAALLSLIEYVVDYVCDQMVLSGT